jgi:D-alanyl-D-alanine dipeptidase
MTTDHPLILISPETHDVLLDLLYATPRNIAGRPIYARELCLLHHEAERCLREAVQNAALAGYRLKIFDAFRPHEAQVLLWDSAPDKLYVADPAIGSNHTRGTAIDLTLVDAQGEELDMGTGFDDMTLLSHHFNEQVSASAQANRLLLLRIMTDAGFEHIAHEWWHYALPGKHYPLINHQLPDHMNPMRPQFQA